MAIALTTRGSISSAADSASYASGSFTPSANVLLVAVYNADGNGAIPTTPSLSGHGTWTNVHELAWQTDGASGNYGKMFIFALDTGASPGASTLTFDHGGTTHLGAEASIFELSGTDVVNGVAQSFVQFVDSSVNTDGGASQLALTLAAAGNAANRPFMAQAGCATSAHIPQTNWTTIHELSHATPNFDLYTEWRSDAFDTAAFVDYTGLNRRGGIAFEVKALVAAPPSPRKLRVVSNPLRW